MHGGRELIPPDETKFDKERMNGAINEMAGRAKRQVGEWTGDRGAQAEGLAQEMKGKAQQAWCGVKDALRLLRVEAAQRADSHPDADSDASFRAAFRNRPQREQH